jgi:hypothetical protein
MGKIINKRKGSIIGKDLENVKQAVDRIQRKNHAGHSLEYAGNKIRHGCQKGRRKNNEEKQALENIGIKFPDIIKENKNYDQTGAYGGIKIEGNVIHDYCPPSPGGGARPCSGT